jgi:hypothetical protein
MPDTLQDLTLQLSRDISALDAERRRRLAALEQERHEALHALPAASKPLQQLDAALAAAIAKHKDAVAKAAAEFENAISRARGERSNDDVATQEQYVEANRAEDEKKSGRLAAEDRRYEQELADIATGVRPDRQVWARDAAYQKHKQLIAGIEDAWRAALGANRERQQLDRQALLEKERVADERAVTARQAAVRLADAAYGASVETAQSALSAALAAIPVARALETEFAERRAAIERECAAQEDQLRAAFREARRRITGPALA